MGIQHYCEGQEERHRATKSCVFAQEVAPQQTNPPQAVGNTSIYSQNSFFCLKCGKNLSLSRAAHHKGCSVKY